MGRGLLSRLDVAPGASATGGHDRELASIADHLRVLLNAKQGSAAAVPQFGMLDFADVAHGFPGSIPVLQSAIRGTVLEFERRLKNVSVRFLPDEDPLALKFEISAQLERAGAVASVRFQTQMAPGGRVSVR